MSESSESYSKRHTATAGLTLKALGLKSWSESDVIALQQKLGADVKADGWFGPASIAAFVKKNPASVIAPTIPAGKLILNGAAVEPPEGLRVINYLEPGGLRASQKALSPRTSLVTQFVMHRGSQAVVDGAKHTLVCLEAKKCSTTFIFALDGTIYQTFDPAKFAGRHTIHHNHQSDALDVVGPVQMKKATGQEINGVKGQDQWTMPLAIGREDDDLPPASRKVVHTRQWSPTPAQQDALAKFVPWWCDLRKIPLVACVDPRTFRLGGLGPKDPISSRRGIFGHIQIAGPGSRVDGAVELETLFRATAAGKIPERLKIEWIKSWVHE